MRNFLASCCVCAQIEETATADFLNNIFLAKNYIFLFAHRKEVEKHPRSLLLVDSTSCMGSGLVDCKNDDVN